MQMSRKTLAAAAAASVFGAAAGPAQAVVVDGFESAVPSNFVDGVPLGPAGFADATGSTVSLTAPAAPAVAVPGAAAGNAVLRADLNVTDYAGVVRTFSDVAATQWVSQDWSAFTGVSFWLHGNNTSGSLYFEILDNHSAAATGYDVELWRVNFVDDFSGWRQFHFGFGELARFDIANGAPDDGLGLTEVHGWALGAGRGGPGRTADLPSRRRQPGARTGFAGADVRRSAGGGGAASTPLTGFNPGSAPARRPGLDHCIAHTFALHAQPVGLRDEQADPREPPDLRLNRDRAAGPLRACRRADHRHRHRGSPGAGRPLRSRP